MIPFGEELSRRSLLAGGGLALLSGRLGPDTDGSVAAHAAGDDWRRRAFGQQEVNVCYAPMEVVRTEPAVKRLGHTGVLVRKGPSFDADPAPRNDGKRTIIPAGRHAARQSVRRGSGPGCPPARPRPAVNGFVWVYPAGDVAANKSGWVPLDHLAAAPHYGTRRRHGERWICGPAHHDFDCRSSASKAYCDYDCGAGDTRAGLRYTGRRRRVLGAGGEPANSAEEYYLRWAASSTAFAYLTPGDIVFELGRKPGYSYGPHIVPWSFVEVRSATYVPAGTRGFCLTDVFLPPRRRFHP